MAGSHRISITAIERAADAAGDAGEEVRKILYSDAGVPYGAPDEASGPMTTYNASVKKAEQERAAAAANAAAEAEERQRRDRARAEAERRERAEANMDAASVAAAAVILGGSGDGGAVSVTGDEVNTPGDDG